MNPRDIPTRIETRARLRTAAWRTECCGLLYEYRPHCYQGKCSDCPLPRPTEWYRAEGWHLNVVDSAGQRARYPDDWHPHEYYMQRVRLFAWRAGIALVGAVAWMVMGML